MSCNFFLTLNIVIFTKFLLQNWWQLIMSKVFQKVLQFDVKWFIYIKKYEYDENLIVSSILPLKITKQPQENRNRKLEIRKPNVCLFISSESCLKPEIKLLLLSRHAGYRILEIYSTASSRMGFQIWSSKEARIGSWGHPEGNLLYLPTWFVPMRFDFFEIQTQVSFVRERDREMDISAICVNTIWLNILYWRYLGWIYSEWWLNGLSKVWNPRQFFDIHNLIIASSNFARDHCKGH